MRKRARPAAVAVSQAQCSPFLSVPDTAASVRGLSSASQTCIRPRQAPLRVSVFRGALRDHLRRFTPPYLHANTWEAYSLVLGLFPSVCALRLVTGMTPTAFPLGWGLGSAWEQLHCRFDSGRSSYSTRLPTPSHLAAHFFRW